MGCVSRSQYAQITTEVKELVYRIAHSVSSCPVAPI